MKIKELWEDVHSRSSQGRPYFIFWSESGKLDAGNFTSREALHLAISYLELGHCYVTIECITPEFLEEYQQWYTPQNSYCYTLERPI